MPWGASNGTPRCSILAIGTRSVHSATPHSTTRSTIWKAYASAPSGKTVPQSVRDRLSEPLPTEPRALEDVYREFTELILPYGSGNAHPRFFGWVQGAGTPTGALADFLASIMNPNVGGRNHGAIYVERAVIEWFRELFAFPEGASGVLTVGTSAANLIAVLVARARALGPSVRETGVTTEGGRLIGYASSATHSCVRRAFEV